MADDLKNTPSANEPAVEDLRQRAVRRRQAAAAAAPGAREALEDLASDYEKRAALAEKWRRAK